MIQKQIGIENRVAERRWRSPDVGSEPFWLQSIVCTTSTLVFDQNPTDPVRQENIRTNSRGSAVSSGQTTLRNGRYLA